MATVTAGGTARRLEVDGDLLEITPLGAGAEVGRSCCVVRFRGKVIMFDCGIHPAHSGMSTLPYFDHINPGEVDLLLVTHFHLDHSGAVPYFVNRTEFKGKVYMTHPTRPICLMLWHDYARVSKIAAEDQIFSSSDIEKSMGGRLTSLISMRKSSTAASSSRAIALGMCLVQACSSST